MLMIKLKFLYISIKMFCFNWDTVRDGTLDPETESL